MGTRFFAAARLTAITAGILMVLDAISPPARAQEITALEIMERADARRRGESQQGTYEMTIVRPARLFAGDLTNLGKW